MLIADRGLYVPGTDMYDAFAEWLNANGYQKWTSRTFADGSGSTTRSPVSESFTAVSGCPRANLTASRPRGHRCTATAIPGVAWRPISHR